LSIVLLFSGCISSEVHDEYKGALLANEYLRLNYVTRDFKAAESLVYPGVKGQMTAAEMMRVVDDTEKKHGKLIRIESLGHAMGMEEKTAVIHYKGSFERGELYYAISLKGDEDGYEILGLNFMQDPFMPEKSMMRLNETFVIAS